MRTRTLQLSFAGGEISPEMFGRVDAREYAAGAAELRNWIVKPQGVVRTRPGMSSVNLVADQSRACALLPFVYSIEDALVIEAGEYYFRFHLGGGTLSWCTSITVGQASTTTVDVNNDWLVTETAHGLTTGDLIRVVTTPGTTLPGGVASFTDYQAVVIDSRRVQLSLPGPVVPLAIGPGLGDGFIRIYVVSTLPAPYVLAQTFAVGDVNTGTGFITLGAHEFRIDDPIIFTTTSALPTGLVAGVTYYVAAVGGGSTTIQVKTSLTGAPIASYASAGAGTHTVYRRYSEGELAFLPVVYAGYSAGQVIYSRVEHDSDLVSPPPANWYTQTGGGTLTMPSPYSAAEARELNYDQSGDVLTLVHPSHPERELRRYSALRWAIDDIAFGPALAAPVPIVTRNFGEQLAVDRLNELPAASGRASFRATSANPAVAPGDALLCTGTTALPLVADTVYIVNEVTGSAIGAYEIGLRSLSGGALLYAGAPAVITALFAYTDLISDNNTYRVASVDATGTETVSASTAEIVNNLDNPGASNTLQWAAVPGATKYRVYKKSSGQGLFGAIGETTSLTFVDSGIPPDLANTTPVIDPDVSNPLNYSRATARFEQRRLFGGSDLFPRRVFMSRNGTESDFSSRIPVLDDDRISIELAAREAHVIRHIVPIGDLVVLTQQGEWRVYAINSDAITPTTVAVRPQSYVGASTVRPIVANTSLVYCANRGGHVREMGFEAQRQGYVTGDLSLRASHLFDDFEIRASAYHKAPVPILWFVSTSGKLLGLTYVPEERIAAWHQHTVGGDDDGFEAVVSIPEGREDATYVATRRTIDSVTVRRIERLGAQTPIGLRIMDAVGLDSALTFDGTVNLPVTISGQGRFAGDTVTLTSTGTAFSVYDVGRQVVVAPSPTEAHYLHVTAFTSGTLVTCRLLADLPADARGVAFSSFAFATKSLQGLTQYEGHTVTIVHTKAPLGVDAPVIETRQVVDGRVSLTDYATQAVVGYPFTSRLRTLPLVAQIEAAAQGRSKGVNNVWLRVYEAAGLTIGTSEGDLVPVRDLDLVRLQEGEKRTLLPPRITEGGSVWVEQSAPVPATVLSVVAEVQIVE